MSPDGRIGVSSLERYWWAVYRGDENTIENMIKAYTSEPAARKHFKTWATWDKNRARTWRLVRFRCSLPDPPENSDDVDYHDVLEDLRVADKLEVMGLLTREDLDH